MQEYYQCRVTIQPKSDDPIDRWYAFTPLKETSKWKIKALVERVNWTFSSIEVDPDFEKGVKCYATFQFHKTTPKERIIEKMEGVADFLKSNGHKILRTKIELVVYDNRNH